MYIYISLCVYKTRERATLITFTPLFEGQPHARKHRPQIPRVPAPHCIYCVSLVLTSVLATRQFPESRTGFQNDTTAQIISQKTEVRKLTSSQRVLQMDVLNNNFQITMSCQGCETIPFEFVILFNPLISHFPHTPFLIEINERTCSSFYPCLPCNRIGIVVVNQKSGRGVQNLIHGRDNQTSPPSDPQILRET